MFTACTPRALVRALIVVAACAVATAGAAERLSDKAKPESGFIPDYSLLQRVPKVDGPRGTQLYRYRKPGVTPANYHSALVDAVVLNQTQPDGDLTADVLEQTRAALEASVRGAIAARPLRIVDQPGPGVVRISVAISGAELEGEGFKPRNLLPVSAVLKIASRAAGMDAKTPTLLVESKLVDSQSGDLLGAGMITIAGESFRQQANTAPAFKAVTQRIVEIAVQTAANPAPTP